MKKTARGMVRKMKLLTVLVLVLQFIEAAAGDTTIRTCLQCLFAS